MVFMKKTITRYTVTEEDLHARARLQCCIGENFFYLGPFSIFHSQPQHYA